MSSVGGGTSIPYSPRIAETSKMSRKAVELGIGISLGIALFTAGCRVLARFHRLQHFLVDDGFFFLATITLIAGTTIFYIDIPYLYLEVDIQAGLQAPPADYIDQHKLELKLHSAFISLFVTSIFCVKFSFLFFFRMLIRQQKKLMWWWWTVFVSHIIGTLYVFFCQFIACVHYEKRFLIKCVGENVVQFNLYRVAGILDIITDILLISIPVLVLLNLHLNLRRKFALAGVFCLSIFMILIAILRIALINDWYVDGTLAFFLTQLEGCVGLMVVSVSAFRALYVARQTASKQRAQDHEIRLLKDPFRAIDLGSKRISLPWTRIESSHPLDSSRASPFPHQQLPPSGPPSPIHKDPRTHIQQLTEYQDQSRIRSMKPDLPLYKLKGTRVTRDLPSSH